MTKEEFKKLWEADEKGSGITFDDIADRAKEWGLFDKPKCCDINIVRYEVLKAAKCVDAEEFNPNNENLDMNLQEDYCSSEVSKLLKEKGFDWNIRQYYALDLKTNVWELEYDDNQGNYNIYGENIISAPTHQLAMKWLRENNIIITPQPEYFSCDRCESWGIDIWAFGNYEKLPGDFPKYEEAVEAALKYCLTKLI